MFKQVQLKFLSPHSQEIFDKGAEAQNEANAKVLFERMISQRDLVYPFRVNFTKEEYEALKRLAGE